MHGCPLSSLNRPGFPGVAKTAEDAKVETIVLTHMVPEPNTQHVEQTFMRGVGNVFKGKVVIAKDLILVKLEINSKSRC